MNEFQLVMDCFKVRYSSKVDAVIGSHLITLNLMQLPSPSKFKKITHPRRPHGSDSAMAMISLAILCRRPQGSRTSPQDRWVLFAVLNSDSNRWDSAETAAALQSSSELGYES